MKETIKEVKNEMQNVFPIIRKYLKEKIPEDINGLIIYYDSSYLNIRFKEISFKIFESHSIDINFISIEELENNLKDLLVEIKKLYDLKYNNSIKKEKILHLKNIIKKNNEDLKNLRNE